MRLYGKEHIKAQLDAAAAENRLPHAVLLYGEHGVGKRVMAHYTAKLTLCGVPPCESCAVCRKINAQAHPDVIYPKRILAEKGFATYRMGEHREFMDIINSFMIRPNDGDYKVYIFEDFDEMLPQLQNTLLKSIEEPAKHIRFVFTCENINKVITTIRSRVAEYEVHAASEEDCAAALVEHEIDRRRANELAAMFSGNIGRCIEAERDSVFAELSECSRRAASGIARGDFCAVAAALSERSSRTDFDYVLNGLMTVLRDALAHKAGQPMNSGSRKEAADIAAAYSEAAILGMLDTLFEVIPHGSLNLNLALSAAYITAQFSKAKEYNG
ncbi:MAG: ATP-binding protein [Oscillospiraceae bacterium]